MNSLCQCSLQGRLCTQKYRFPNEFLIPEQLRLAGQWDPCKRTDAKMEAFTPVQGLSCLMTGDHLEEMAVNDEKLLAMVA